MYPEYTGTALTAVLKLPPASDPAAVLERVRAEYRKRWNLEWLDPLGFNNTFAMVVRGPDAQNAIVLVTDKRHSLASKRVRTRRLHRPPA